MCHKLTMSGGIIMKFVHGGQIMVIRGYNHNHCDVIQNLLTGIAHYNSSMHDLASSPGSPSFHKIAQHDL